MGVILKTELDEADSLGLRFDSHNDAVSYVEKIFQDSLRRLAVYNFNVAKNYMSGKIDIRLHCRALVTKEEYHLVFCPIPDRQLQCEPCTNTAGDKVDFFETNDGRTGGDRSKDAVFVGVADFVQCPEKIVPSFVWLEPANQINNLLRERFATSFNGSFKLSGIARERERGVPALLSRRLEGVAGLVERRAQVVDRVSRNVFERNWHGLSELDLVRLTVALRIILTDVTVGVSFEEFRDLPFEVLDVLVSPRNAAL